MKMMIANREIAMYEELDKRIIDSIAERRHPLYNPNVVEESRRIAKSTGREEIRITDGRLQALRKAGKIYYGPNPNGGNRNRWHLADQRGSTA